MNTATSLVAFAAALAAATPDAFARTPPDPAPQAPPAPASPAPPPSAAPEALAPPTPPSAPAPASPPATAAAEARAERLERELAVLRERIAAIEARAPAPAPAPAKAPGLTAAPAAAEPFAFADFSWMPGNYGSSERPLSFGPFTGELRVDTAYHWSFNRPADDTISGSSEVFRHNELQLTHLGVGGDVLYKGVQARLMTQFGMYSTTTPRNDASPGRGAWDLANAYRYISEAYGGYHFDVLNGINVQAGIFMSYVGLWSYYNFDNWTYQPSYVSSNTPWFFNGARIQFFPSDKVKLEPWLVNGWQSYGKFNQAPGVGLQIQWRPTGSFVLTGNQYYGTDTLGTPDRRRVHFDYSVMVKLHDDKESRGLSRVAASLTVDAGCEWGGGTGCDKSHFLGFMSYVRAWFWKHHLGATVGGGAITNPGRYLVLVPPINGATAFTGTPYFSANPGDPYKAWDLQVAADVMPAEFITFRLELNHRAASVPYFTGPGGVTPPGGVNGAPATAIPGWTPDLARTEDRLTAAILVKY